MSEKRLKRLVHLVAHYPDSRPFNLEDDLKKACLLLPTVEDRRFDFKGKKYHGLRFEPHSGGFGFQFAVSVPGESISTLENAGVAAKSTELGEIAPPDGNDFSDGDIICLVNGNNVFACPSVLRESYIGYFLNIIFEKLEMKDASRVIIMHAANKDAIRTINNEGIKSIHTKTVLDTNYILKYLEKKDTPLLNILNAFIKNDKKLLFDIAKSNPVFSLSFAKSRFTKKSSMSWATDIAREFIDNDVPYIIETLKGTMLSNSKMTVSKKVRMEKYGKSVFVSEALQKLEAFKNEIITT